MSQLFGFQINRKEGQKGQSPVPPSADDPVAVAAGGYYGTYVETDAASQARNEFELIRRYRDMALHPEVDSAIDEVDLIVSHPSEIGMNVIVNKTHAGLIYKDAIFKDLSVGDKLKGIVKKIRPGNKLDITLGQIGYRNIEPNAELIMHELHDNSGFLNLTDKSDPQDIKAQLQMSKKNFKKAVGTLYKQHLIEIKSDGIYLV